MPLFYQHNINGDTKLGIWRIEEPEAYFLQKVPLKKDVSHPSKRLQHLAGRWLLPFLFPDFPLEEIQIADTRKPFLESEKYHFSIAHCGPYAAAIVSGTHRVGVDIESITPRIRNVAHKFLDEAEMPFFDEEVGRRLTERATGGRIDHLPGNDLSAAATSSEKIYDEMLTLMWSAKESIFKWYGLGEMDFRKHMQLKANIDEFGDWLTLPFGLYKEEELSLAIEARIFHDLALTLTWVVT
jgi:phosphopantetheinyl transferase